MPPPPSSERMNGLALMTIHKDIHFKYDDVIDNAAESSFTV